jgi:hypothetical protein
MIEIILSFFLLVTYFIRYLFSTGENRKQKTKADLKEFWASNEGQGLFGAAVGLVISIIVFGYLLMTQINF